MYKPASLPPEELVEVLGAPNRKDYFIAGVIDGDTDTLRLWRGDGSLFLISLDHFTPSGDGTKPDFAALSIGDYGHTILFGSYESAGDWVLENGKPYEVTQKDSHPLV